MNLGRGTVRRDIRRIRDPAQRGGADRQTLERSLSRVAEAPGWDDDADRARRLGRRLAVVATRLLAGGGR